MGDSRFEPHYERVRTAADTVGEIAAMDDAAIIQALAAASTHGDQSPYLANVLASEALNRLHRARIVYEHIAEGVLTLDDAGSILAANPAARRLLGYASADLLGRPLTDLCAHHADHPERCAYLRALHHGEVVEEAEDVFYDAHGDAIQVSYSAAPVAGEEGVQGVVVAWRDITVSKEFHRKLVESEARYRSLFDHSPDLVITLDARGRIVALNPAGERITGVTASAMKGLTIMPFLTRADQERAAAILAGAFEGRAQQGEFRIVLPDGAVRIYDGLGVPIIVDGRVVGVHGVARNVTQMRHLEESVRLSEARHRLIMAGVKDHAIVLLGQEAEIASWNPGAEALFGWKEAQALGKPYADLFRDDDATRGQVLRQLETAARAGRAEIEEHAQRADQRLLFVSGVLNAITDASGEVQGYVAVLRDSTPRRRAQVELRRALAVADAFTAAREVLSEAILRIDAGRIETANRAFLELLGRDRADVLGQPVTAYIEPSAVQPFERALEAEGLGPHRFATSFCDAAGRSFEVDVAARRVQPYEGSPRASFVLVVQPRRAGA